MAESKPHRRRNREPLRGPGAAQVGEFLATLRRRNYSDTTIEHYRGGLKDLLAFLAARGCARLQDVTAEDLDAYRLHLDGRPLKVRTIEHYLRSARLFFGHLAETQQLFMNPARDLALPRVPRDLQPVPTEPEIERLLAQPDVATAYGVRDRAILEVLYSTAMRLAELVGLSLFDPDLDRGTVRVLGKGRKERTVPLGSLAVEWLKPYLAEVRPKLQTVHRNQTALWLGKGGAPLGRVRVQQMLRDYAAAAGISTPISPHTIRRACATHMLARGAHPVQVQMLLGHASLRSLSQYLRVTVSDLKQAHRATNPGR